MVELLGWSRCSVLTLKYLVEHGIVTNINASIVNPANSTVPIAAKALQQKGVYGSRKLFGVTTLDMGRARTFVAEAKGQDPTKTKVPVIGGHARTTIAHLLSQTQPAVSGFSDAEHYALTHRIVVGGDKVVKAKPEAALLHCHGMGRREGHGRREGVTECTFVETNKVLPSATP